MGVASFHRACLLAQDFTHEPACQTGDSAPQGRFRHQPEQMVHPPFAWQLASFPSLPVCGEEAPYCPLRDCATLRTYSPEIKAQQAILGFLPVYPELVAVVGNRVPDYRGRFLRGLQSGHSVGETVANTIKSHNHTQPTHTHSFSGQLVSTAISGTAAGQKYSSTANLDVTGTASGQKYTSAANLSVNGTAAGKKYSSTANLKVTGTASGQTITNGGATGQTFSYEAVQSSSGGYFVLEQNSGHSFPRYYSQRASGDPAGGGIYVSRYHDDEVQNTIYVPLGTASTSTATGKTSGGTIWGSTGGGAISGAASGTVSGIASSSAVAGTATGTISGTANASSISGSAQGVVSGTTHSSSVSGSLRKGNVSGVIGAGGGNPTDYTGASETAPDHIYVRCLIRAKL